MLPVTDEQLAQLVSDLESDRMERKRSASDGTVLRRNICAFANDLPGHGAPGILLIGVEDDGSCSNATIDDALLRRLASMKDDGNIMPIPSLVVQKRVLSDCEVAAVFVEPARSPPARFRGRAWVRVGPTVRPATPDEEHRLSERRRAEDRPHDLSPAAGATAADLDLDYLKLHYLPQAVAEEVLRGNRRPLRRQLQSLRLLDAGTPVRGALLGFAKDPQAWLPGAYVQFLRIDGRRITDPIRHQQVLTGRLEDILRRLEELLALNVTVRTTVAGAERESRRPNYPLEALRQLARNAVMHRLYHGTNAPTRVHWYADRVEIHSPGGLYGRMKPENFGRDTTDYRNPLVAEIMHNLGFAQRFGLGVPLARRVLEENGNPPPEFDFQPAQVAATVTAAT